MVYHEAHVVHGTSSATSACYNKLAGSGGGD